MLPRRLLRDAVQFAMISYFSYNRDMKEQKVTSTEFQNNVGRYQDAAQLGPVTVTKNGRDHTVLVSATFFETVLKGRVARRVEDLDDDTIRRISEAEVPAEFADLDDRVKQLEP